MEPPVEEELCFLGRAGRRIGAQQLREFRLLFIGKGLV